MAPAAQQGRPKHGPFTTVGWLAIVGGTVLGYVLLKRYEADKAATSSTAAAPTTTEPLDIGSDNGSAGNASPSGSNYSSMQAWVSAMIGAMTSGGANPNYSNGAAFNDVTSWINGSCVSTAGFGAISQAIGTIGLPPGYDPGTLSVCPTAPAGGSTSSTTGSSTQQSNTTATASNNPVIGSIDSMLPMLDTTSFPSAVAAGQWNVFGSAVGEAASAIPTGWNDFTQVGGMTNGVYSGQDVLNGAPLYGEVDGKLVQNPGANFSGPLYVPSILVGKGYVGGDAGTPAPGAP